MDIFDISASALTAQRMRLDVIASNLANANSTHKADGSSGAYKRRNVIFAPFLNEAVNGMGSGSGSGKIGGSSSSFANHIGLKQSMTGQHYAMPGMVNTIGGQVTLKTGLTHTAGNTATGVRVSQIIEDSETPERLEYNPSHPDADEKGLVHYPNINVVTEMVDMIAASRSYEANVNAIQAAKAMASSALQI